MSGVVQVIGAGMAGCEAAWQLAQNGVPVVLWEMKPQRFSPAHHNQGFAELVCSNSLKAERMESAAGLLKAEMELLGSLLVPCAKQCRVPAGGALAVDRERFSELATEKILAHPLIEVRREEAVVLPQGGFSVIATGPLTDGALAEEIASLCGGRLSFFDAAAPIVTAESIDFSEAFYASRYERGGEDDYLNCPMNKEQYEAFYAALIAAEGAPLHDFDGKPNVYEGCMPIEIMAKRGANTIRFGPLKPVGLRNPRTGHRPWANVQLRREDRDGRLFNLVGFQTNLKFSEQKRVFGMIPALKNADFVRYGVMHRNTFLDSPRLLDRYYADRRDPLVAFAGQITGVEGYVESTASGCLAAIAMAAKIRSQPIPTFPKETAIGAMALYISDETVTHFQPMNVNFGIIASLDRRIKGKAQKNLAIAQRALESLDAVIEAGI